MQVASHAQKYFKHVKAVPKEKRRESILDIISADAEATRTSQIVISTKNENTLPHESFNAEQTITVTEGQSAGHAASYGAVNAPENMVVSCSRMTRFAVADGFSTNSPQDTVAAHASQLPPFAPSSNFDVGDAPM
ncbi:hypothetical protein CQW23_33627 [Capsicum baccatum]|uniref:HTH myb-type domain-containing protein n=1 Tax=Capsicum baccatum TaxID=33114 RepID=A0A2G2V1A6_CAPBA|nr:hypothetical protein CQW23_33627 [Capsicum baccatum]